MNAFLRRIEAGPAGGFDVYTHDSGQPGPRAVLLDGVHGDETEGAVAVGSRTSPLDGENLTPVFPGAPAGNTIPGLAHHILTEVLSGAGFLIDLHTFGRHFDMPFLAGYRRACLDPASPGERAAVAFGADFVWRDPGRSEGRTVSVVEHVMYAESPGGGPTSPATVGRYVEGVLRVPSKLGIVGDTTAAPSQRQVRVTGGGDLDCDMITVDHDGIFLSSVGRGSRVEAGDPLGRVIDVAGRVREEHRAQTTGYVIALKRPSSVRAGDMIVCLAAEDAVTPAAVP